MGKTALSWSGGKDACLVLDYLLANGISVEVLITTKQPSEKRTYGHGEKTNLLVKQSESLGIPIHFIDTDINNYTDRFVEELKQLKLKYDLEAIAFGDIYFTPHKDWGEKLASTVGLQAIYPLWRKKEEVDALLKSFIQRGYRAKVIRVRPDCLSDSWLGREIDDEFFQKIKLEEVCPMGEAGEYHSFVYDGPIFSKAVSLLTKETVLWEGSKKVDYHLSHDGEVEV
ncbi:diphthine--ammonia ligase [Cytobacillus sp. FSL M8-0252]|uniref:Dph6-related ATP pyrophosphatase n=1 Tax=Cytobacillus sp. FSL M8-0252 TaxID=2921621 RepID=UPI0030FAC601